MPTDDLTWLLTHGRRAPDLGTLVETFCRHLRATGLPVARASINVRILHPLLVGRGVLWMLDAPLQEAEHERGVGEEVVTPDAEHDATDRQQNLQFVHFTYQASEDRYQRRRRIRWCDTSRGAHLL